jgi:hypothetical protein
VGQEVRPVWAVADAIEGEVACEALRAHGIKCALAEVPSTQSLTSPLRALTAIGSRGMVLAVIVAPEDVERAHQILSETAALDPIEEQAAEEGEFQQ